MKSPYRETLDQLRLSFPQPVSDRVHDAYFVFSILRALDKVDAMKSEIPFLGIRESLDYVSARSRRIPEDHATVEEVTSMLVKVFEGLPVWGHPRAQINVVPPPSIPSVIGALLPLIYNPNLVSDDTSVGIALAEAELAAMSAALVGYDPAKAAGIATFGGTGTVLYGVKIGLEKAIPAAMEKGVGDGAVVLASGQSHYSKLNIGAWLGIGEESVIEVPTRLENDVRLDRLEQQVRAILEEGRRIAAIIATMGTTDAFGVDDLEAIVRLRDRVVGDYGLDYTPHIHADAVIGWAWSVFNDYDFEVNTLGFRPRTVRALANSCRRISKLHLADSLGIDFHKTGFAPYVSSLFLLREGADFALIQREKAKMPYLFQAGERHPGMFTLETTRSACGVLAALANLLLLGKRGFRSLIGHLVEMAELLREHLEGHSFTTVVNGDNVGPVTLFRVYPDGVDTWTVTEKERVNRDFESKLREYNEYNRQIFERLRAEAMSGRGVLLSMTECYRRTEYGAPIVALKSYMLSPFIDEEDVELIVSKIIEARQGIAPRLRPEKK